jgi:hypothetical protein
MWNECVIDASMSTNGGFTFCPIEGDIEGEFEIITGLNFVGLPPKGMRMVAVVHPDGPDAVNSFCEAHRAELDALTLTLKKHDPETYDGLIHDERTL